MYPDAPKMSEPQRPAYSYEEAAHEWTTARERRDATVVSLNVAKEEAHAEVVKVLEELLVEARQGRWEDIIVVLSRSSNSRLDTRRSLRIERDTLLGRLMLVQHEILRSMDLEG